MVYAKNTWQIVLLGRLYKYIRKRYLWIIIFVCLLIIYTYTYSLESEKLPHLTQIYLDRVQDVQYLINTSTCRIPDDDPFNKDIIEFLKDEKPYKCSEYDLLTYIDKTYGSVTLNLNETLLKTYSSFPIQCCYSNITRINYKVEVDNEIKLTNCVPFEDKVTITFPYIRVHCYNIITKLNVYTNVHATTLPLPNRTKDTPTNPKFSILMVGIDSMSKSSIKRNMPKTYNYLENKMYNIKGYNKVGLNTFPNLMTILTGHNEEQLVTFCNRSVKLNDCRFIWDKFREAGYITAYAEDECAISTFNYDRPGFSAEPTDFYYHSYFLAAEQLVVKKRFSMTYCAGPETSGDRIINAAQDFSISFKDVPTFGLFWTNSFSHDDINMPAVMDESIFKFLSDPQFVASLETTILVFFSDHGFRFGNIRYTHSGWLEERLPFIYVHIPLKFQLLFPQKFNNFLTNTERLTNNYDLYNTFQDILEIGNNSYKSNYSQGCPKCNSLFKEVPENRTCEDAGIPQSYCTCKGHTYINPENHLVQFVSEFVVNEINIIIKISPGGNLCSMYSLDKVHSAGVSEPYINHRNQTVKYYLIMIDTKPPAIFEATVEASFSEEKNEFTLLGDISRIDRYKSVTGCLKGGSVQQYCYCSGFLQYLKSFVPFL